MKNSDKAFTLIELLVVIAIIGLLSSVVLASLSGARESARDARRQQDMRQFEIAAEMYYQEHGRFPGETYCDSSIGSSDDYSCNHPPQDDWSATSSIQSLVDDGYMDTLPIDPINDSTYYYSYEPQNRNEDFCVRAQLEGGGYTYARVGSPPFAYGGCGA